ncbi:MAG: sulfatase-like hydrolase/transferase [Verrucomicrobiales bacterium]|nr:sulfatase-like hydrolase/transferase [Verrucomicrobiales bacterium]
MKARLLVFWIWLTGCGVALAEQKPNILFLLVDDQRPDTIGAYGNEVISTPNLDKLAEGGLRFTRATCSYPICHISRAEMLSGRHGWENGINGMGGKAFRKDLTFWADALKAAGYQTCYVGKWHTPGRPARYGYDTVNGLFGSGGGKWWEPGQTDWKGFPITGYKGWVFQNDTGKEKYPEKGVGLTPDIDAKFGDAAIDAIRRFEGEQPWFVHVNFTGPHDPLFIPPGYEGKYRNEDMPLPENFLAEHPFDHGNLRGRDEELLPFPRTPEAVRDLLRVYYSVIDHIDLQVGRIVEALKESGQLNNTLIIYSSDHGMSVGSHGLRGKQNQYEHTINVPLIMAGPTVKKGISPAQVYLRELYPTTCELAGIPVPESVTAKSFADVVAGKADAHHDEIFGYFTDSQRMIRTDQWKYIVYPQAGKSQLFNLEVDPFEKDNLVGEPALAEVVSNLSKRLGEWRKTTGDPLLTEN